MNSLSKFKFRLASLALAFFGAQGVSAGTFTYTDIDAPGVNILGKQEPAHVYTGIFDIVNGDNDNNVTISGYTPGWTNGTFSDAGGFVPGTLTSATAFFYLKRADSVKDSWDINVDIVDFLNGGPGATRFTAYDPLGGASFQLLNDDGIITYTVENLGTSQFYLEFARIEAKSAVVGVPEGGATVAMLGVGLLSVGMFRRRTKAGV